MSARIIVASIWWIVMFVAIALTGCSQEPVSAERPTAERIADVDVLHDAFRIRRDSVRGRIWVVGVENVRVYDGRTGRPFRRITLPNWSVARLDCDPDMVLDRSGSAIVSSNVQSRLWRIDAESFEVSEHLITLQGREFWDVGFGALAVNGDGTLLALTAVSESLWSIDLATGSARTIVPSGALLNVCGHAMRTPARAAGALDAFVNFVPAAGSDYAVGSARPGITIAQGGQP